MIFTFYSYKGGVGRSMALANVAEYFYRRGLRVLMIDWDLEAPGLETFFYNLRDDPAPEGNGAPRRDGQAEKAAAGQEKVREVRSHMGLLDLLLCYKRLFPALAFKPEAPVGEKVEQLRGRIPVQTYIYPVHAPGSLEKYSEAALWLVPAGWREGERFTVYSQGVQSINWSDLYESFEGQAFFEWLRAELEAVADVILIDSRTGVTEMGGVCTRQLADVVVSFAVLNNQNIEGVARMNRSFVREEVKEARGRELDVVAVPTRIDQSELKIRLQLKELFQKEMGEVPAEFRRAESTFWSLNIPYVSQFAYFEKLAIGAPEAEELENAYINLATHLVLLAPDDSPLKERFAEDLRRRGVASARTPAMSPALPEDYVRRPREYAELKRTLVTDDGERREAGGNVLVQGPAGSGKSLLAASVCKDRQVAAAFPDGVLWATLGVSPDPKKELTKLYAALTGDESSLKTLAAAQEHFSKALANKSCLVVVDDVWSEADLRPFLYGPSGCTFVVVSRDVHLSLRASKTVLVGGLSAEQSARLLAARARQPEESYQEFEAFAERLGGNALFVRLAGDALQNELGGSHGLEEALEQMGRRLAERGPLAFDPPGAQDRHRSVGESIAASLRLLSDAEMARYVCALFALEDGRASLQELADAMHIETGEAEETAKTFQSLSLVSYDASSKEVSLHPALRAFLLERLPANVGLDVRAEHAYAALSPEKQKLAERTLPRLVRLQGQADAGRDDRHLISIKEFDDASQELLQDFAAARVVSFESNRLTGERTVQFADGSLVGGWARLREWVGKDRPFLFWRQKLWVSIREWKGRQRTWQALLTGGALSEAKRWLESRGGDLEEVEKTYISESARQLRRTIYLILAAGVAAILLVTLLYVYISDAEAKNRQREAEQQQKLQKVQEEVERKAREDKSRADSSNAAGLKALDGGDVDAAIISFSEAINSASSSPDAYKNRARAYLRKGFYDLALTDLNLAIQLGAKDDDILSLRDQARKYIASGVNSSKTPSPTPTPTPTPASTAPQVTASPAPPAPQPSGDIDALINDFTNQDTPTRRGARAKLIALYPQNSDAIRGALMAALLPESDARSYLRNIGVVTVLAGVGSWEGTADELQKIQNLTQTSNYRDKNFKAATDRALRNYRPKGSGAEAHGAKK